MHAGEKEVMDAERKNRVAIRKQSENGWATSKEDNQADKQKQNSQTFGTPQGMAQPTKQTTNNKPHTHHGLL